jgi:hypothetical protein
MPNEFLEKVRTVGVMHGGRTRPKIVEGVDADGARTKAVTDELGNTVTEHANSRDQVDVHIRAPLVQMKASPTEVRSGL